VYIGPIMPSAIVIVALFGVIMLTGALALILLRRQIRRIEAGVEQRATARFQEMVRSYDEADREAMMSALAVRKMAEEEFRLVGASAQCVLWHAEVVDVDYDLLWDLRVFVEEEGDFINIERVPVNYRVGLWYHGRDRNELLRLGDNARNAIRGGLGGYRQEFLCHDQNGKAVWFQEDARIKQIEPKKYHLFGVSMDITDRKQAEEQRERLLHELQEALAQVKQLRGMLPICAGCKKIRDDSGYWQQIESYIHAHADVEFSHGLCPDCIKKLYPDL